MCRIAGILSIDQVDNSKHQLQKMLNVMARGGPDDEGIFSDGNIHIGHRRLSIIDLSSAGHQPMVVLDRIIISFNGEIYNYKEIRRELERGGTKFRTATDTEVIVQLYLTEGPTSFKKLRGMFAFALFDMPTAKLFLVRDPSGIKPLYFHSSPGTLMFASEVKAFKAARDDWDEDKDWKVLFLAFGFLPHPFTTLKNVSPVPPGSYVETDTKDLSCRVVSYEKLLHDRPGQTVTGLDAVALIREKTLDALKHHLISDATLGVFLSGGIDSSLLTLLTSGEQAESLRTVSVNFDEAAFDERTYQEEVLRKTKHHNHQSYRVDSGMFWAQFDDIWNAMDQPSVDGVNTFFVSQCAHQSGLKVVLSGLGADELFGGYASVQRAGWLGKLRMLPGKGRLAGLAGDFKDVYRRLAFLDIEGPTGDYLFLRGVHTPCVIADVLQSDEKEVWETLSKVKLDVPPDLDPLQYVSFLEYWFYMSGQLLKDTDYMSMRFGLEVRVPFLDIQLVKAVQSISSSDLYCSKQPKYLLTKAFENVIPREIIFRKKQGFTFPFHVWLKSRLKQHDGLVPDRLMKPLKVKSFLEGSAHWSKTWSGVVLNNFKP